MDFINPNFEIRNKNSNSDNKKDIKKKQDISAGKNIQTNLAKPSGKLLQAYNKISFKGDTLTNLRNKHQNVFSKFKNPNAWNHFRNTLCAEYSDAEIDALLNEISSRRIEDSSVCNKFLSLININNVENITYGDGIQDPITKRAKTINIPRALTPIEAKELIVNRLTKNSNIERYFNLVDDEELMPDIAINIIKYDINDKDKIRIENLSNELFKNNRKLSKDEIMTCLAFSLDKTENIQDFIDRLEKDYSGKKLDLFEAALCTVHNLDDGKTERFFELKSKQLPYKKEDGTDDIYTLSSQEAVLCAKEELDEDELKRYAELKNKPFMYTSVRDHNSSKVLSSELIISYIKNKNSNEEIAQLAKYDFKDFRQYEDFKSMLKVYGFKDEKNVRDLVKQNISYIAKLQDKNGKNIFKGKNGEFILHKFKISQLTPIRIYQLTSSQAQDYIKILTILKSMPNRKQYEIFHIAAKLAKLQDGNGNNILKEENGEFNFCEFSFEDIQAISNYRLTSSQVQDYIQIRTIIESTPSYQKELSWRERMGFIGSNDPIRKKEYLAGCARAKKEDISTLAAQLARLQDENGNNIFKKENGEFKFDEFSFKDIQAISNYRLTSAELQDYIKLKKSHNFKSSSIAKLTKLQDENGKNIFKKENGEFDFGNFNENDFDAIMINELTASQVKDYKQIVSILKSMPYEWLRVELVAAELAKLQDENKKNIFQEENGEFDFNGFTYEEIEEIGEYKFTVSQWQDFKFTRSQFQDFKQILPILKSKFKNIDVLNVAGGLAKFQDENENNVFKKENGEFDFDGFTYDDLELMGRYKLTAIQLQDYRQILPILKSRSKNMHVPDLAAELSKLQDENGNNIFKKGNGEFDFKGFSYSDLEKIVDKNKLSSQYDKNYRYLTTTLGIDPENAVFIAKNEDLMAKFRLVDPNIFWQGATGEDKQIFDLFNSILVSDNIDGTKIKRNDFYSLPEEHTFNNGTLSFNPTDSQKQGYSVALQKASKNSTPIMIVKNQNGEKENYIAYDGTIALLRPLQALSNEQKKALNIDLSTHPYFSIEEINALEEATRHFIVDIIEENGECIISKGIDGISEPFIGETLDTEATKNKYKNILSRLHNNSNSQNITIENILRLMPKDAMIQIKPYATSKSSHDILYSISAEWEDKDGKEWQLRVHSHDLKFADNGKSWIYRLGYQDSNSLEPLFYDNNQNDFIAGSKNPHTHIFINSPQEYKSKLISNPYFQKAIRNISISFNKTQYINKIADELNIHETDNELKKNKIIEKCQQNTGYYYKYKKVVDGLLNEKGLPPLDKTS
ncbi:hypothetical protein IJD15_03810 [bacterium]|nr:hypothetical protein [bacterium]